MFRWYLYLGLLVSALLWQFGDPGQVHAQRVRGGSRPMMVRPMMTPMVTPNFPNTFRPNGLSAAPAIRAVAPTRVFDPRFNNGRTFDSRFDRRMGGGSMSDRRMDDGTMFSLRMSGTMFDPRMGGGTMFDPRMNGTMFDPSFR